MSNRLNKYKYPGAKRLMLEAQELKENTEYYCAQPVDDNLFEWHFTVKGPPDTPFDGGYYHGRLSFPTEYPMKPPSIILLTPNGRFVTNKKICLSISGFHPETWQPSWSVRTALLALIAFMPTEANHAIGSLNLSANDRRALALKSRTWRCETCGLIKDLLVPPQIAIEPKAGGSSLDDCRPTTSSRVNAGSNDNDSEVSSQSSNIPEIDYNSENSDSSQEETLLRNQNQASNLDQWEQQAVLADNTAPINYLDQQSNHNLCQQTPNNILGSVQGEREAESSVGEAEGFANQDNRRRAYHTLILKSIFVLLSLLILRRVMMLIQS